MRLCRTVSRSSESVATSHINKYGEVASVMRGLIQSEDEVRDDIARWGTMSFDSYQRTTAARNQGDCDDKHYRT